MSFAQDPNGLKTQLQEFVSQLQGFVSKAAADGMAIDQVELGVWKQVLQMGRLCLGQFIALQGDGDMGETIDAGDGREWQRLPELHLRRYVSIFGEFALNRVVYGTREGQKIAFVPLDNRLLLPAGAYSYVLQDWSQSLCVESAFGQVSPLLLRFLGVKLSVGGLEAINEQMAERVEAYREDRPAPAAETEGELLVASADGKGIVMRRQADDPAPAAHRSKGEKASKKQMATVASVYTVDRHLRTAEDVVAALFRDPRDGPPPPRPKPQNKHVWAQLCREDDEGYHSGIDLVFEQMFREVVDRNRAECQWLRPMLCLCDGQESLWEARERHLPRSCINIVDLLHVTPRLWKAAYLFHKEKSEAAEHFVRERCLRVLRGEVKGVIRGLREMGTKRGLTGPKKKSLAEICNYLRKNQERMRYDEYLAQGYPIASGVIEGACRHLVKDRMERAGMHWTPTGAQAMLDVRSVHVDGEWEQYQTYRIKHERKELYPHRHLVEGPHFALAV